MRVLPDTDAARVELRGAGWSIPTRKREDGSVVVLPGPYAIPLDGLGWGRGYWQADVLGDNRDLIVPGHWPVPAQAAAACAQLHLARQQFADFRYHALFERAVVARYNADFEPVRAGLLAGNPDIATTGGDYSADVFSLRRFVRARWPGRFPNDWSA